MFASARVARGRTTKEKKLLKALKKLTAHARPHGCQSCREQGLCKQSYTVIVTRCCEACAKNPCELCDEASKQVCVACSQNELETVLCSKCAIQQKLVPKYVPPPTRRLGGCSNSGILLVGEGDGEGIESNMRVFDLRGAMLVQDV